MGDTRIGGPPPPPPQPDNIESTDSVDSTSPASLAEGQNAIQADPEVAQKTGLAEGQGAAIKSELNLVGDLVKSNLQSQLSDLVPINSASTTSPQSTADLVRMNVVQNQTDQGMATSFPNGVIYTKGGPGGADNITPPPGGSVDTDSKTGNLIVRDAKKNVVAELGKDGNFMVHSKFGEYTMDNNGQVSFRPNQKDFDGAKLHKPGTITQDHFEDYGISTDGKTMRFPNGMNFDLKTHNITYERAGRPQLEQGQDGSRKFFNGDKLLYKLDKNGLHIPTPDGTITMNGKGELSFEPGK